MNKLSTEKRAQILHCIVEGNSLRATARLTDTAINTVVNLMIDAGKTCSEYQDKVMVNLKCKHLQFDEIWSFVGAKEKNVPDAQKGKGRGDIWTWTALDSETKLVPCWFIAMFAFPGSRFLFIPMAAIREVVEGLTPGKNGSLIFTINVDSKTLRSKLRTVRSEMELNIPEE